MFSLGVHVEFHTPTLDLHLPFYTVQIGRNNYDGRRFAYFDGHERFTHSDNCDHAR